MTPFIEQWQPDQHSDQAEMLFSDKMNEHTHTPPSPTASVPMRPALSWSPWGRPSLTLARAGSLPNAEHRLVHLAPSGIIILFLYWVFLSVYKML